MLTIKVLGSGCPNCQKVAAVVHEVVDELAVPAAIVKVTEPAAIHAYPILATPGLVIDEKVVCAGRIPAKDEVTGWVKSALA